MVRARPNRLVRVERGRGQDATGRVSSRSAVRFRGEQEFGKTSLTGRRKKAGLTGTTRRSFL